MSKNGFKTFILLAGLTALLLVIGQAMGGRSGLYMAFIMALVMNFIGYWFSDKIALKMSGAQEVTVDQAPDLHRPSSVCPSRPVFRSPASTLCRRIPPMRLQQVEIRNTPPWPLPKEFCGFSNPKNWKGSWPMNSPISRTATS